MRGESVYCALHTPIQKKDQGHSEIELGTNPGTEGG